MVNTCSIGVHSLTYSYHMIPWVRSFSSLIFESLSRKARDRDATAQRTHSTTATRDLFETK
jgi:hypothetical protein